MFSLDSYLCTHLPCVYSTLWFHDVRPWNNYYYNSCEIAKKVVPIELHEKCSFVFYFGVLGFTAVCLLHLCNWWQWCGKVSSPAEERLHKYFVRCILLFLDAYMLVAT